MKTVGACFTYHVSAALVGLTIGVGTSMLSAFLGVWDLFQIGRVLALMVGFWLFADFITRVFRSLWDGWQNDEMNALTHARDECVDWMSFFVLEVIVVAGVVTLASGMRGTMYEPTFVMLQNGAAAAVVVVSILRTLINCSGSERETQVFLTQLGRAYEVFQDKEIDIDKITSDEDEPHV